MKPNEILRERLQSARAIAWDECHKIYILMDDDQLRLMQEIGYEGVLTSDDLTPKQMYAKVRKWYNESCGLRFINAVSGVALKEKWETIVGQGERFYGQA